MNASAPHPLLRIVDRLVALLAAVNRPIASIGRNLSAGLIGAMVALALAQILSRALFSYTLDWAEELARVALVWSVLLVGPFAYRSGAHVAIGSLAESLPPRLLVAASAVLNLLVLWICVEMFRQSLAFWSRGLALTASALGVQMAWIYVSKAMSLGFRVKEIPAVLTNRKIGASKFKFKRTATSHLIFSIFEKPMMILGFLGLMTLGIGLLLGLYIVYLRFSGDLTPGRPLITFALLMILGGIQILSFGFVALQILPVRKEILRIQKENVELRKEIKNFSKGKG